jgi:predicted nucleotidyltransferase
MSYGLSENDIIIILNVFTEHTSVEKVILFGSRAKGNYKSGSDIDLAIIGNDISFDDFLAIKIQLGELNLPYHFDVINHETITDTDLLDHIARVGIIFYEKDADFSLKITKSL